MEGVIKAGGSPLSLLLSPTTNSLLPSHPPQPTHAIAAVHAYVSLVLGLLALVFPWTWGVFFTDGGLGY